MSLQTLAPRGGRAEEGDRVTGARSTVDVACARLRREGGGGLGGTFPLGNRPLLAGTRRSLGLAYRSLAHGTSPEPGGDLAAQARSTLVSSAFVYSILKVTCVVEDLR